MRNPTRSERPAAPVMAAVSPFTDPKRRRFLLSLGVVGAGAATAAAAAIPGATALQPIATDDVAENAGYRETPHVRDYYRTAKL